MNSKTRSTALRDPRARALAALLCGAVTSACTGGAGETDSDTSGDAPRWSEVIRGLDSGVLLSGAVVGDEVIFVGGHLSKQPGVEPGGPGYLLRYRDGGWCRQDQVSAHTLWWIDSPSADEWYAVGDAGTILRSQGGAITDESVGTEEALYGVRVQGARVYAVGGDAFANVGEIWRRDAGAWTRWQSDLPGVVFKVWDGWFVGDGVAWQLEGDALVEHPPPDGRKLLTVHGDAAGDVWAVGGQQTPTLLRWVDGAWESHDVDPECAQGGLNGVWLDGDHVLWIAGNHGGVGSYDGATWTCPEGVLTIDHFHAVLGRGDVRFAVGGNLLSGAPNYASLFQFGPPTERVELGSIGPC